MKINNIISDIEIFNNFFKIWFKFKNIYFVAKKKTSETKTIKNFKSFGLNWNDVEFVKNSDFALMETFFLGKFI